MKIVCWKIEGMHCEGCAKTIEARLAREAGVRRAEVSFPACSARILLDPEVASPEQLVELIERAGYRVVTEQVRPRRCLPDRESSELGRG
ncbi:MAG: heavy-metal-associated domain-containing protein [Polaromonas sp.]